MSEPGVHEITFEVEARALEGMRKLAVTRVHRPGGGGAPEAYALICDEGAHLGGEGSAPTPPTYFVAGVAL